MKKLVAAVLTGVLVAGTLSTGVYAKDDDKTITVAASATPHAEILEEAKPLLEKEGYRLGESVFPFFMPFCRLLLLVHGPRLSSLN